MKKLNFLILCFWGASSLTGQNNLLRGIVTYQSSGSKPVEDVEIKTFDANKAYSDNAGLFELRFNSKKEGDKVRLMAIKDGFEVVNSRDLEEVFIRSNPDEMVRVVICKAGERAQQALQYYDIIVTNINRNYDIKLNELNSKLDQLQSSVGGNQEEQRIFLDKIRDLEEDKEQLVKQAEELAQKMADTDLDQASELSKKAFVFFQEGEIKKAIETLDDEQMDQSLKTALEERDKAANRLYEAEDAIWQSINNYMTKAQFCKADYQFEEAEKNYLKAISADSFNYYNIYEFASFLEQQNQFDRSLEYYRKALENTYGDYQTASALMGIGGVYLEKKDYKNALSSLENVLQLQKKVHLEYENEDSTSLNGNIAETIRIISVIYLDLNDYTNAEKKLKESIAFFRKDLENYQSEFALANLSSALINLGLIYIDQGKFNLALNSYHEALSIYDTLDVLNPKRYLEEISILKSNMGLLYLKNQNYSKSFQYSSEALEIARDLSKKNPAAFTDLAFAPLNNLAAVCMDMDRLEEAEKYGEEYLNLCLALEEQRPNSNIRDLASAYSLQGEIKNAGNHYNEAIKNFSKSLETINILFNIYPDAYFPDHASLLNLLGNTYIELEKFDSALVFFNKLLESRQKLPSPIPNNLKTFFINCYHNIGSLYIKIPNYPLALENFKKATPICRQLIVDEPESVDYYASLSNNLVNIGYSFRLLKKHQEAVPFYQEAVEVRKKIAVHNPDYWYQQLAASYYDWAMVYHDELKYRTDESLQKSAIQTLDTALAYYDKSPDNAKISKSRAEAAGYLEKLKIPDYLVMLKISGKTEPIEDQMLEMPDQKDQLKPQREVVSIWAKGWDKNPDNIFITERLAEAYGNLAWTQIFNHQFEEAEKSARKGLQLDPNQIWINTNVALSLLLQGKLDAAKSIYSALLVEKYTDGRYFKDIFLDDLDAVEQAGITHKDISAIRDLLSR